MGATTQVIVAGDAFQKLGAKWSVSGTLAMSSSYATSGDSLTARGYGLSTIDDLVFQGQPDGYTLEFDKTNLKVLAYTAGTQVTSTTDLSAVSVPVLAIGV